MNTNIPLIRLVVMLGVALVLITPFSHYRGKESRNTEIRRLRSELFFAKAAERTAGKSITNEAEAFAALKAGPATSHLRKDYQWTAEKGFSVRPYSTAKTLWINTSPLFEILGITFAFGLLIYKGHAIINWVCSKKCFDSRRPVNLPSIISRRLAGVASLLFMIFTTAMT